MSVESWKKLVESTELHQGRNPDRWRPLLEVLRAEGSVWDTALRLRHGGAIRQRHVDVVPDGQFCFSCGHRYEEGEWAYTGPWAYTTEPWPSNFWHSVLSPCDRCLDCWVHDRRLMDPIDRDGVCQVARPADAFPDAYGVLQCLYDKEGHPDEHYAGQYVPEGSTEHVTVRWPVVIPA